jgi:hypothetical protein
VIKPIPRDYLKFYALKRGKLFFRLRGRGHRPLNNFGGADMTGPLATFARARILRLESGALYRAVTTYVVILVFKNPFIVSGSVTLTNYPSGLFALATKVHNR